MKNPWIKKNPFMSMWLSCANRIGVAAVGQGRAAVKRQAKTAATKAAADANQQMVTLWNAAFGVQPKPKRRKRR